MAGTAFRRGLHFHQTKKEPEKSGSFFIAYFSVVSISKKPRPLFSTFQALSLPPNSSM